MVCAFLHFSHGGIFVMRFKRCLCDLNDRM